MSDLSNCLSNKTEKAEAEKVTWSQEEALEEANQLVDLIVDAMDQEQDIVETNAKESHLLSSDIIDGNLCLKYQDDCIVRSIAESELDFPKNISFEEMPLVCPIVGCKSFLRLHQFHRHMFRFHRSLEITEAYSFNEKIPIQIKIENVDKDFKQTVCHGFFHLLLPKSETKDVWKTRMPVLIMTKVIDMKELGFDTWKNHPVSDFYLMVWFIGIQCSGIPKIQIDMSSNLFGTKNAMLRCAQHPQDTINLLTTHSSIFFNQNDVTKIKSENNSVFNVEIEVKLCEDYKGFDISKIHL